MQTLTWAVYDATMPLDIMPKKELTKLVRESLVAVTGIDQPREHVDDTHRVMLQKWHTDWQPAGDLSFYEGIDYAWQTYDCWDKWSNSTVRVALNWLTRHYTPRVILDYGAGIGATTAQIAMAFPDTRVWYSNVEGYQRAAAERLFETLGLRNVVVTDQGEEAHDCLFAVELFEHIKEPIPLLERLESFEPTVILDGSSFHVDEVGHWDRFLLGGAEVDKKTMRHGFTRRLAKMGFKEGYRVVGGRPFWNRHPRMFCHTERFTKSLT